MIPVGRHRLQIGRARQEGDRQPPMVIAGAGDVVTARRAGPPGIRLTAVHGDGGVLPRELRKVILQGGRAAWPERFRGPLKRYYERLLR